MLQECKYVLIIIGSANKEGTLRNPLPGKMRFGLTLRAINEIFPKDNHRISVKLLDDLTYANNADPKNNPLWGDYLYQHIVDWIGRKKFAFYSGEDISQSDHWFGKRLHKQVTPVVLRLDSEFWGHDRQGVSATRVRRALKENDRSYVKTYCPTAIYERFDELREVWLQVLANPQPDFSTLEVIKNGTTK
jgi:hypothetical protein